MADVEDVVAIAIVDQQELGFGGVNVKIKRRSSHKSKTKKILLKKIWIHD